MAQPILIPADLWQRLAALDRRCNIGLVRGDWEVPGGGAFVRAWRVTISERRGAIYNIVRFDAPALAHALEGALAEAERRGWVPP